MKLRNKKTGEIKDVESLGHERSLRDKYGPQITLSWNTEYENLGECRTYNSLAELNEEWEDYEEKGWYITGNGEVRENRSLGIVEEESEYREIGNYFETEEEAEKAVEKLKAWKRLKDEGLTFCAWKITDDGCSVDIETTLDAEIVRAQQKYITDDLDLLFGGEE